jgi:hypothetical protein
MLKDILNDAIVHRHLSVRAAAREIGVSHTTINRVLDGDAVDLDTLVAISNWLGMRPAAILGMEIGDVNAILDAMPALRSVLEDAAALVQRGEAPVGLLEDIASYIKYKVSEVGKREAERQ